MKENKKYLILILFLIIMIGGLSWAYFRAQIAEGVHLPINVTTDIPEELIFHIDHDLTLNVNQFTLTENGKNLTDSTEAQATYKAGTKNRKTKKYYVYLNISENNYIYTTTEEKPEILLKVEGPDGEIKTDLNNGEIHYNEDLKGYDITTKKGLINIALDQEISSEGNEVTIDNWKFSITFIDLETNQAKNANKNLKAQIIMQEEAMEALYIYEYQPEAQEFVVPVNGTYKIELWGASGGSQIGGKGAYTRGNINLKKDEILYVYVGEQGFSKLTNEMEPEYTFNGGASGSLTCLVYFNNERGRSFSGGGATDIRLIDGSWDDFNGLKSRIMVAAGGGGSYDNSHASPGGYAGGLTGGSGEKGTAKEIIYDYPGLGATQKSGGAANGTFGKGGVAKLNTVCMYNDGAGGGSGYYGGGGTRGTEAYTAASAGGGSSFISGYPGCNAITADSTEDNIKHTDQPDHYSGKVFTDALMIAGNASMPSPYGENEIGHSGNGYAKITLIKID